MCPKLQEKLSYSRLLGIWTLARATESRHESEIVPALACREWAGFHHRRAILSPAAFQCRFADHKCIGMTTGTGPGFDGFAFVDRTHFPQCPCDVARSATHRPCGLHDSPCPLKGRRSSRLLDAGCGQLGSIRSRISIGFSLARGSRILDSRGRSRVSIRRL